MPTSSYADAVRETLAAEMRAQTRMIFFDAGAADPELLDALRQQSSEERVRSVEPNMPLTALLGAAAGAARMGSPVLVQGGEALLSASTPAFIDATRKLAASLVLRVLSEKAVAAAMLPEHWLIAAPSLPADAAGLLRSALRQNQAALFVESPALFALRGSVPVKVMLQPGLGAIRREGRDLTLVTVGASTAEISAACDTLAAAPSPLQVEVVDLRTIQPLDTDIVTKSLRKTGRLLLCPQSPVLSAFSGAILRAVNERAFDELDAPVRTFDGVMTPTDGWREALCRALQSLAAE